MKRTTYQNRKILLEEKRVKRIMRLFEETMASDFDPGLEPGSKEYKKMVKKSKKDSIRRGDNANDSSYSFVPAGDELTPEVKTALDELEGLLSGTVESNNLVDSVLKILNGPLNNQEGRWALQQGTENDQFEGMENGGKRLINDGSPSQSNIFISKSVAYAMCSAPTALDQIDNKSKDKGYLKINIMTLPGGKYVILDGHHRWSQQFTFGSTAVTELDTRVFNFPGMDMGQTLSRLQVGIAANTEAGKDVPAWYTDPATGEDTRKNAAAEDKEKKPEGSSDNLLGASKSTIIAKFHELLNKVGTTIDKGIKHAADNTNFMGDKWCDALVESEIFQNWIKNKQALKSYQDDPVQFGDKTAADLIENGKIICPLREAIAQQCAEHLANTVCKKEVDSGAPDREFMPQLDHEQALGSGGEERLLNQMEKGKINHSPSITSDAEKALSETIQRWNKLAGTLFKG